MAFSPLTALRYRDFRLLWIGQMVSTVGTQMRIVAVNWHIYQLAKASGTIDPAFALGLIGLVRVIPIVLTALFSGVVADRADRRQLLVITSIIALIASGVLAFAAEFGFVSVWLIYALVALTAVASAFEMPARQAIIPGLVSPQHLPNALSLNIIAWQAATVVGPSLAGILIAAYGVAPVYWIDAATFIAVVISAVMIKARPVVNTAPPAPTLQAAFEGLRFVFRSRMIASTMLLDFFATFFGAAMTLLPLFADQVLHVGPTELGWMYAAPSVGATLAALTLTSVKIPKQGPVLLFAVIIFGICTALFGVSRWLPLTLLALAGTGASDTVSMVIRSTMRQLLTPDELRGRMTAVNMVFFAGGPQLGEFEAGVVASLFGGPLAVLSGGVLCVLAVVAVGWAVPELRRYNGPEDVPAYAPA